MAEELSREDFLDKKKDYSPFLVHLTRDGLDETGVPVLSAREILDEWILTQKILLAGDHFCLFDTKIKYLDDVTKSRFKVTCFTETPLDQIEVLVKRVQGRTKRFEPFGLVFKKNFIRQSGGNPVFYASPNLFDILWQLYETAASNGFSKDENRFLSLVNKFDETFEFHWEREWRIVGDLVFKSDDIYCGLCPEDCIQYFEGRHPGVVFISPLWGINRILDKLVEREKQSSDIPF